MRQTIGFLAAFIFVGVAYSGGDDARAIVNKGIKAAGGEANLAKFNSMTWKEKGTYYGMGDGLPYTGKHAIAYPDKFRMEIEGVFTVVLNGDKGWMRAGGETKEMSAEQLAVQRHDNKAGWISNLLVLKDKAFTLKTLPDAKVGDAPASVVLVTRKDFPEVKLFFSKKTNLLIKSEYRTKSPEQKFKDVTMEMNFSDFREIGGAMQPHKMLMKRDGERFVESEMLEIMAAPKLDPKTFARPE